MDNAVMNGTYEDVRVLAPYTNMTKTDIARRGQELGIDYSQTWSCYRGGDVHCGECGTCRERKDAFKAIGAADPTEYLV